MGLVLLALAILYLCGCDTGTALAIAVIGTMVLRAIVQTWKEMK